MHYGWYMGRMRVCALWLVHWLDEGVCIMVGTRVG